MPAAVAGTGAGKPAGRRNRSGTSAAVAGGAERRDRPELHPRPRADAHAAEQEHAAGDHRHAGEVAGVAADGDQAAAHGGADLVARLAVHEDDAAAHALEAATVAGPDQVAGVAADVDAAA